MTDAPCFKNLEVKTLFFVQGFLNTTRRALREGHQVHKGF